MTLFTFAIPLKICFFITELFVGHNLLKNKQVSHLEIGLFLTSNITYILIA